MSRHHLARGAAAGAGDAPAQVLATCEAVRESVSAGLDEEAAPLAANAVADHLARCAPCRAFAAGAARLVRRSGDDRRRNVGTGAGDAERTAALLALLDAPLEIGRARRRRAGRLRPGLPPLARWAAAVVPLAVALPALAHGAFTHPAIDPSHAATACTAALDHLRHRPGHLGGRLD